MLIFSAVVHRVCLFGGFGYILKTNPGLLFETEYYLTTRKKRSRT